MAVNKLAFQTAEEARDAIQASQQKEIAALYEKWGKQIGKKANEFAASKNASATVSEVQMRELEKMLKSSASQLTKEVNGLIVHNIYTTANVMVQDNTEWLASLGFDSQGVATAFSHVPTEIVQKLVTGQIYKTGWSLSKAIWGSNQQTLKDIYEVVAAGVAQNMPAYDIAKLLEQYVSPSSKKPWNLKTPDGKRIYKKQVDYNAQRLARTLIQHGYQQSFIATTKENPFVEDYIWNANGSRACELCKARNGKHFPKNALPMDHPNGMCTMVPNTPSYNKISDRLADWVKGGDDPALDKFAKKLGFDIPSGKRAFTDKQEQYLKPYGFSPNHMPKDFDEWSHLVTFGDGEAILESMGTSWNDPHPYQKLQQYFNKYLMSGSQQAKLKAAPGAITKGITNGAEFAAKYGTSSGAKFNYWYTKLDPEAKEIAKTLKDTSGKTWQQWYEDNIYKGKAATPKKPKVKPAGKTIPNVSNVSTDKWIAKIKKQTESHMLSTEAKNFAKMSNEESQGLRTYTGSAYSSINGYLRQLATGKSKTEAFDNADMDKTLCEAMNNAINGLRKVASSEDLVLRRGTDLGDLAGLMAGDFKTNLSKLQGMSVDELNTTFTGHVGTYAGFTSTSSLWDRGFANEVEIVMNAPAGTQGSSIMSISKFGTGEGEFLLNAGTQVQVVKVEKSDGHSNSRIRVFMDVLGVSNP